MGMKGIYLGAVIVVSLAIASCNKAMMSTETAQTAIENTSKKQIVATYSGKEITLQEIDDSISQDMYDLRRQSIESMIVHELVKKEAKKLGKSENAYIHSIVNSVEDTSEDELRKIYQEHKQSFGNRPFNEVASMLAKRQKQKKQQAAIMNHIADLKKKANVRIQLPRPRITVKDIGPSKGPADAPITIVEFSDFQCPYCSQVREVVDKVVSAYDGKVRLVFRDFPLQFHDHAAKASEAGLCAESQGKFWEMHDWMFDNQDKLSVEELKKGAASLGIDGDKFNSCLDSGENAKKVKESVQAATNAGLRGTPAFFVNGIRLTGNQSFENFKEVIDEELQSPVAAN